MYVNTTHLYCYLQMFRGRWGNKARERKYDLVRERTRKKKKQRGRAGENYWEKEKRNKSIWRRQRIEGGKERQDRECIAYNSRVLKAAKLEAYNFTRKKCKCLGMMSTYSLKQLRKEETVLVSVLLAHSSHLTFFFSNIQLIHSKKHTGLI